MDLTYRRATRADNDAILRFYDTVPLEGEGLKLRSRRSPDFFRFLDYQGPEPVVVVIEGGGEPRVVGTICFRDGYIGGKTERVAYLGDFRATYDRRALALWRRHYPEFLHESNVPFITALIDGNMAATNAFVNNAKAPFVYERLSPYWMVNVLGRWPLPDASKRLPAGWEITSGSDATRPELEAFLDRQARERAFGYVFAGGELARRLRVWDGLRLEDFLILRAGGKIAACFAPWSPAAAKVNVIEQVPWIFQLGRPLLNVPERGSALQAIYLTHLEVERSLSARDRQALFGALFGHYYHLHYRRLRGPRPNFVGFADYPAARLHEGLRGFITQRIPMTLYSVRHRERPALVASECERAEPGFEIALV